MMQTVRIPKNSDSKNCF